MPLPEVPEQQASSTSEPLLEDGAGLTSTALSLMALKAALACANLQSEAAQGLVELSA